MRRGRIIGYCALDENFAPLTHPKPLIGYENFEAFELKTAQYFTLNHSTSRIPGNSWATVHSAYHVEYTEVYACTLGITSNIIRVIAQTHINSGPTSRKMNDTETPLHKSNTSTMPQDATTPPASITTLPQCNQPPPLSDQNSRLPFPRLIAAYLCLCLCYFTTYLDTAGITTAMPTMSTALSAGPSITWAETAYLLGQTALQPLYGRLSDITGRKSILLASIACTALGGLLCGFTRTPMWLHVARAEWRWRRGD